MSGTMKSAANAPSSVISVQDIECQDVRTMARSRELCKRTIVQYQISQESPDLLFPQSYNYSVNNAYIQMEIKSALKLAEIGRKWADVVT